MVIQDRIRLTGLLRKKPWKQGFFYWISFDGTPHAFGDVSPAECSWTDAARAVHDTRSLRRTAFTLPRPSHRDGRRPSTTGARSITLLERPRLLRKRLRKRSFFF